MQVKKICCEHGEVLITFSVPKGVSVMRLPADEALLFALSLLREVATAFEHPSVIPPVNRLPVIRDALRELLR